MVQKVLSGDRKVLQDHVQKLDPQHDQEDEEHNLGVPEEELGSVHPPEVGAGEEDQEGLLLPMAMEQLLVLVLEQVLQVQAQEQEQ